MAKSKKPTKSGKTPSGGSGRRDLTIRVKSEGRKASTVRWLQRQLNDPYVTQAKKDGWRSRAAYKLIEIDDKQKILKPGQLVIDLGAAPGSWTQVALDRIGSKGKIIGIDLLEIEPITGVDFIQGDFTEDESFEELKALIGDRKADVILSDMAPNTSGHRQTDHIRIVALCELAVDFAIQYLKPNGVFLAKIFQGGAEKSILDPMRKHFKQIRHVKPKASRADSSEMYVLAQGFRLE
ncbi:MAG: RlmE family RNA methyltransferase [Proteobacteria bacterium]|nr:RlmE family RNA methyltransferase [Pseudomonadota bacterium]